MTTVTTYPADDKADITKGALKIRAAKFISSYWLYVWVDTKPGWCYLKYHLYYACTLESVIPKIQNLLEREDMQFYSVIKSTIHRRTKDPYDY